MAIWNLGSINIDHVYRMARLPAPGETVNAASLSHGLGGKGANQSAAAARAGATVRHVGAMGAGDDWVIERLAAAGIDCTHVARLAGHAIGHALILVDDAGENAIVVHPGANRALSADAVGAALARIGPADTLLIQNETNLQVQAAAEGRAAGARVIYSAAPFEVEPLRAVMPHVSILALNEPEAAALEQALGAPPPVPAMLVTRGARGAEYRDLLAGTVTHQPAFPVRAVDSTGAGDCFAGWFAAALDAGNDVPQAMRRAAAAAAIQVTRPGAGDAMPDRAEVEAFLSRHP
ncbi:ribokinase [Paracoccus luteus]|uniref:ribokinase n=1 Tax=Paracoccus luteus TaxID=2508543 RepID=UPI00106FCAF7|nr:ribokinase [Paracoccus luteus]